MLGIYFDKAFLDNFYIAYNPEKNTVEQSVLYKVLTEYPETVWYIETKIDTVEQFESLKQSNPLIALKSAGGFAPIPVESIKEHLFQNTDEKSFLVFSENEKDWFEGAENKGVLCFSFDDYEKKIKNIVENYHYSIDLNDRNFNWTVVNVLPNLNRILINDGYILTDVNNQKIDENLIPLLNRFLIKQNHEYNVEIYANDFRMHTDDGEVVKEKVKERKRLLDSSFANLEVKFKIINNSLKGGYDFHDRWIYTNFQHLYSGRGFNLIPRKNNTATLFYSKTIFDLSAYKIHKNNLKLHKKYFNEINSNSFQTIKFTYYPNP